MLNTNTTILRILRILLLAAGVLISWYTVIAQFVIEYRYCGTVFPSSECLIQSPLITPCFYGACAFFVSFAWVSWMYKTDSGHHEAYLRNFLLLCVVFALSVLGAECAQYFGLVGGPAIGCTPGSNPLLSPCAAGAVLFGAAYIVSWAVCRREA